jgi:phosphoglycolate phosphatase-like HAD superfamily hydrolase
VRSLKLVFVLVLALGAGGGYVAATGPSKVFRWFGPSAPAQATLTGETTPKPSGSCCSDDLNKSQLLVAAYNREGAARDEEKAKQDKNDPLPSWNDGRAKKAIIEFVQATTDKASPKFVPPEQRIATFDQDGTLWVEHPIYTQVMYCLERVPAVVKAKPELKDKEPFKTVLSGDREAIAKLSMRDLEEIAAATLTGMTVDEFQAEVKKWLATAKHPRWNRPYTELTYQPMLEVLKYLRANGYKTFIVTGGGQDFVRVYAEQVYGIPPEQVVGTAGGTKYSYTKDHKPILTKDPKLVLNDNDAGKPEGIHLMIGRRPYAAFGNSTGDQQMLEYTTAGDGARLGLLLLHDDAKREYAYGPAQGLPDTRVGTFTQALYDEARKSGWVVISMKDDWKRLFPFDK